MNEFESEYFRVGFRTASLRNDFDRKIENLFTELDEEELDLHKRANRIYNFVSRNEMEAPIDFVSYDEEEFMQSIWDSIQKEDY